MIFTSTKLRLHPLFSDHAILQQGKKNPIWGWGNPGTSVVVTFLQQTSSTIVSADGSWKLDLPPTHPETGLTLKITSGNESLELQNLAVGEVWLCSGQSNMEWPMQFTEDAYREINSALDSDIRLFTVPRLPSLEAQTSLAASTWSCCSPETIRNFSAVAYFFARKLRQELGIPVGLIHSSWGGSAIQPWLPHHDAAEAARKVQVFAEEWRRWVSRECHHDPGNQGESLGWADPAFDDRAWTPMQLPGLWESEGLDIDGAVWFRKELDLPGHWEGRDLVLHFGRVDDYDTTYFNGQKVGGLDALTPQAGTAMRVYVVPSHLVRAGKNLIATRIFDHAGAGGILSDSSWHFSVILASSNEQRSLGGAWRMKVEKALPPRPGTIWASMPHAPLDFYAQFEPSQHRASLFNGMIAPLAPYGLKGVLWYQGESNVHEASRYPGYLRELVEGWRAYWQDENLGFYIAQLADWINGQDKANPECQSSWAELREAQSSILALPHTGLAITRDLGDAYDIHPRNKHDVGLRLALQALKNTYGKTLPAHGPILQHASFEKGKAILKFAHAEKGLQTKTGGPLLGFVVSDADGQFHDATAEITGPDIVEIKCKAVPSPKIARYAWASYSEANLENSEGLPCSPFRTDKPEFAISC